jgi:glutaminyl-tRNA synthetase
VKDEAGEITELRCTYFPESRSGSDSSGLNVKGTIHWVSATHAAAAEVRLYDRLFAVENPDEDKEKTFLDFLNPQSLKVLPTVWIEPALQTAQPGEHFQFLRKGYFTADIDSTPDKLVFNMTVGLKDAWAKEAKKEG